VHVGNERSILLECWYTLWHAKKLCEVAIATKSGSRRLKLGTVPSLCVCVSLSLNPGSQNLNERRKLYREFRTRCSRYVSHSPKSWNAVSTSKTETHKKNMRFAFRRSRGRSFAHTRTLTSLSTHKTRQASNARKDYAEST
jgi:hypothetical protein